MPASRRQLEEEVVEYSRRLHARGWVANHDGNVSVRLGDDRFLATPTSISKAAVSRETLIVVDGHGEVVGGTGKAFTEIALHLAVYRRRPDVRAVLHAHPPAATGHAVAGVAVRTAMMAEPVVSLGAEIPLVPYARPKTPEWTASLDPFMDDADALILENHGVLTYGPELETAFLRLELVEHLAAIQIAAHQAGIIREIPQGDIPKLLEARTKAGLGQRARQPPAPGAKGAPAKGEAASVRDIVREEVGRVLRS